mmetsp:Transcript_4965/g.21086  ORF Transcript_4965/g.21086 Transcript_4965/m.21086 type:complete len:376 (-) Transcript_4965:144-1271(-)
MTHPVEDVSPRDTSPPTRPTVAAPASPATVCESRRAALLARPPNKTPTGSNPRLRPPPPIFLRVAAASVSMSTPASCARSSASAARFSAFSASSRRRHVSQSTASTRVPTARSLRETSAAKRAAAGPDASSAVGGRKVTRSVFFPIHATCHGASSPAATNLGVSALTESPGATPVNTTTPARGGTRGCAPLKRKTPTSHICSGTAPSALANGDAPRSPTKLRGRSTRPSLAVAEKVKPKLFASPNTRTTPSPSTGTTERACSVIAKKHTPVINASYPASCAYDTRDTSPSPSPLALNLAPANICVPTSPSSVGSLSPRRIAPAPTAAAKEDICALPGSTLWSRSFMRDASRNTVTRLHSASAARVGSVAGMHPRT